MESLQPNLFKIKYVFFQSFPKALPKPSFLTFSLATLMFLVQQERRFKGILKKRAYEKFKNFKHSYNMPWSNLKKTIHYYFKLLSPIISEARVTSFCFATYIQFPLKSTARQAVISAGCGSGHISAYLDLVPKSYFLLGKFQWIILLGGSEEMYAFVCIEKTFKTLSCGALNGFKTFFSIGVQEQNDCSQLLLFTAFEAQVQRWSVSV